METRSVEQEMALALYRARRKELDSVIERMLGKGVKVSGHPRETRRKLAKQTGPLSVSRMIIEAR